MAIGKTNAGGGASLNFDVKAYATEEELLAATPKENTIGIITTTAISSWVFSATEPAELVEGMVWISTGTSSTVEFNALKKNGIQIYPLSAKQYVSGAWVDVTAMSYLDGKWVELGINLLDQLGGFKSVLEIANTATISENRNSVTAMFYGENSAKQANAGFFGNNKIDFTDYNTIEFHIEASGYVYTTVGVFSFNTSPYAWDNIVAVKQFRTDTVGDFNIDVSALAGEYYFGIVGAGLESSMFGTNTTIISDLRIK